MTYANATWCSNPRWTIPDTGTSSYCNWEEGCSKTAEYDCDDVYGVFEGDICKVYCQIGDNLDAEDWKCAGDEKWELVSEPVDCFSSESDAASMVDNVMGSNAMKASIAAATLLAWISF